MLSAQNSGKTFVVMESSGKQLYLIKNCLVFNLYIDYLYVVSGLIFKEKRDKDCGIHRMSTEFMASQCVSHIQKLCTKNSFVDTESYTKVSIKTFIIERRVEQI